jgi:hypothetical protein
LTDLRRKLKEQVALSNKEIISMIEPTGRGRPGPKREDEKKSRPKGSKRVVIDRDLLLVFEAVVHAKKLQVSETVERMMLNHIKRFLIDSEDADLAKLVRAFLMHKEDEIDEQ